MPTTPKPKATPTPRPKTPRVKPYRIHVVRSKRRLAQRWHVRLESNGNREVILSGEQLRDRDYAVELGRKLSDDLDAILEIDA